ncbi:MAG: Lin1244/Lin1753 domain-containing protein [Candidatus Odinarchaeota archaeon]
MARPQKQTVDYFPHDANASNGDTITIIEGNFGNDGYAFWFKLLERLSTAENHVIDCSNGRKWQLIVAKSRFTDEKGLEIMDLLADLGAIDTKLWREHRIIWCQKFVENISDAYKNRRRPVPEKPVITDKNPISTANNPQTKLNKTKLNNIYTLFEIFWKAYPKKMSKGQAEKAFNKINPDEELLDRILLSIDGAKNSPAWKKENGQFIPYPATWLNSRGWEDEIQEVKDGLPIRYKTPEEHLESYRSRSRVD